VVNDFGKGHLRAVQVRISRAELIELSTIGLVSETDVKTNFTRTGLGNKYYGRLDYW
jgi:hypothetical protein